jgi:choline dehydrogenase
MFDYVIVGAGSAGCALAARLTENPRTRVLLLEAGGPDTRREIHIPVAFSRLFKTDCDWAYFTEPQPHLAHRRLFWPCGKVLGGSSSLNAMIYIRGHRSDYDHWAALGNAGWSWRELLPYFLRSEDQARGASDWHGTGGPLRVEDLRDPNPVTRVFLDACAQAGIPRNEDFNGAEQEGAGLYQVTQRKGRRCSTAAAYLRPAGARVNLGVRTRARALRILFDGKRAIGVEYLHDGEIRVASALREVILCAGAVNSPHLLLLSGVGPAGQLAAHGIECVADVPGVGKNLQDHLVFPITHECRQPVTLDQAENLWNALRYLLTRRGPLTSNAAEAGAFVKSRSDLSVPDLQFHFVPAYWVEHGMVRPDGHGFSLGATQLRPRSRGEIRLRAPDPNVPPAIDPNYLAEEEDRRAMLAGLRIARRILAAEALAPFRGTETFPGAAAESDEALSASIASHAQTLFHPVGTCKMGPVREVAMSDGSRIPPDPMAVVDAALRVRGVEGLRVADASIMPTLIGGNTNAAVIAIAERAAGLIQAQNAT